LKPRVLVTRPQPGAARTAARLGAAGFEPVVLPLTRIEPLDFVLPEGLFDAVIVTSAQALERMNTASIVRLPVFVVGETTAEAARSAGFEKVMTADGSAQSTAALVRSSAKPAARLLYLCGRVRRPELEAMLGAAGLQVTAAETYDAVPIRYSKSELAARLGQTPFDAVTLMSAQAAELFLALTKVEAIAQLFMPSAIICFSPRIAEILIHSSVGRTSVTEAATEDSMFDLLLKTLLPDGGQGFEPNAP
jgi:uroporphyrinogen-III synthase